MEEININIINLIDIIGLVQGLFLGGILLYEGRLQRPKIILGLFLVAYSSELFNTIVRDMSLIDSHPNLIFLPLNFYYLTLPLFYIYVKRISNIRLKKSQLLLILLPGIIEFIFFTILYFKNSQDKIEWYGNEAFMGNIEIFINLSYPYSVVYCILILRHIKKHQSSVIHYYSNLNGKLLQWAKYVIIYLLVYLFIMTFYFLEDSFYSYATFSLINVIFIFWVGIAGIKQSIIFEGIDEYKSAPIKKEEKEIQKANPKEDEHFLSILKLMEEEKIFLHSNVSLIDISRRLTISPRYLSELIKKKSGNNFSKFVNHYRVQEAKRLLSNSENDNFTIMGIAYDSGFSSKASFYKVFKAFTKLTPTEFKKQYGSKN